MKGADTDSDRDSRDSADRPTSSPPKFTPGAGADESSRALLIDASMLAAPRLGEPRRDFEQGLSYVKPLTLSLICFLALIFIAQIALGALASEQALVAAGGLQRRNVVEGEVWRLFSAVFLHGSLDHVAGNCLVLYVVGLAIEHAYGPAKAFTAFMASGLCGSLLSCALAPGPSVGASGGIFGLIGCLMVFFYRFRSQVSFRDQRLGGVLVVWVLYSIITGFLTPYVDNWAHLGGLAGGLAAGFWFRPADRIVLVPSLPCRPSGS